MSDWRFVVAVALALAGCTGEHAADPPREPSPPIAGLRTEAVTVVIVDQAIGAVGTVKSKTQTLVASKVQGYVRDVRARQGDRVEPGDVLVTIDERESTTRADRERAALAEAEMGLQEVRRMLEEADAALRSAEADRVYAEQTATRYRQMWERGLISTQEYDGTASRQKATAAGVDQARARIASLRSREAQMRHRIDQAQAELQTAEIAVGDTRITAQATGVVVDRRVEPGDLAVPGQPLLVLDDPRAYRFEAEVGESAVGRVRVGQRVPVILDALGRTFEGRVAEIIPAADPTSRTVTVKLDLPAHSDVRSGLFGRAQFSGEARQALSVPLSAVVERGQLTSVYVVDAQGIARLRLITTGERRAERVEALSGLDAGERIVVDGTDRVRDGAKVVVTP
jgi:multidrug resistance efflux pump